MKTESILRKAPAFFPAWRKSRSRIHFTFICGAASFFKPFRTTWPDTCSVACEGRWRPQVCHALVLVFYSGETAIWGKSFEQCQWECCLHFVIPVLDHMRWTKVLFDIVICAVSYFLTLGEIEINSACVNLMYLAMYLSCSKSRWPKRWNEKITYLCST
jgi:hypothetical protein